MELEKLSEKQTFLISMSLFIISLMFDIMNSIGIGIVLFSIRHSLAIFTEPPAFFFLLLFSGKVSHRLPAVISIILLTITPTEIFAPLLFGVPLDIIIKTIQYYPLGVATLLLFDYILFGAPIIIYWWWYYAKK